jgi:hypothetical protein
MKRTLFVPITTFFLLVISVSTIVSCGGGSSSSGAPPPQAPPTFDLEFNAPGGTGFAGGNVTDIVLAANVRQDFTLANGIGVTGVVTTTAGNLMSGVKVSYRTAVDSPAVDGDVTDVNGIYTVAVPAGTWVVELDPGNAALGVHVTTGIAVASPGPVTVNLQIPVAVNISGFVLEDNGVNFVGASTLEFTGTQTQATASITATVLTASYSIDLVPDTYEVIVTPAGIAAQSQMKQRFTGIVLGASGLNQNFILTRGITVTGTIFDNLGLVLQENTDVDVDLPAGSTFFPPPGVTANAASGTYTIGPVPIGSMVFEIEPPGDTGLPKQQFTRQIGGPSPDTEDFSLAKGFVLSGVIFQQDGVTPEGDADIEALPTDGSLAPDDDRSDTDTGDYDISLFAGTYNLQITPQLGSFQLPQTTLITIGGDTTLNVTLTQGAAVLGTVLQPDAATPAEDVRVEIVGATGASAITEVNGAYAFIAPGGTHTLTLTDEGGPFEGIAIDPVTGVVVIPPVPTIQDITLTLATTGSTVITGTVFAPDGVTPVANVEVIARNSSGDKVGRAVTDINGNYSLVIP